LQDRYIANRLRHGNTTKYSVSEFALSHLRERGLRGLPSALNEIRMMNTAEEEKHRKCGRYYWGNTWSVLAINAIAFFAVVIGIKIPITDKELK